MSAQPIPLVTADYVRLRVRHYFDVAKKELQEAGPDEKADWSNFQPTGTVIAQDGAEADVPIGFKGGAEKNARMQALSEACNLLAAAALIVRMVGTALNVEMAEKEIHLKCPNPITDHAKYDYYEKKLFEWVKKKTGTSRLGSLPREYTKDFLVIGAIGPLLSDIGLRASYEWSDGKLMVGEPSGEEPGNQVEFSMVPKWWD